jgi:hypothetical protein
MKTLAKVGAALVLLSALMTSGFYVVLKAEGRSGISNTSTVSHKADRTLTSEKRSIDAAITQIEINGPIDLKLTQAASPEMTLRAEQRLMSRFVIEQSGSTLSIKFNDATFFSKHPVAIELSLPKLQRLAVRGSGDTQVNGFNGEQIQIVVNGSGDLDFNGQYQQVNASLRGSGEIKLNTGNGKSMDLDVIGSGNLSATGQTQTLTTHLTGSGDIDAEAVPAETVTVNLNGSGDTKVHAKQAVTVSLRGSGDVNVSGKPSQRNITRTGSGDVSFE